VTTKSHGLHRPIAVFILGAMLCAGGAGLAAEGDKFALNDQPGQYLDVLLGGRAAGRYMYAYDKSTPEKRLETYKPYLHVFDAEGKAPITKGAGGSYTHHRGIFIGWNKIGFGGKIYDRWHMKGGEQVHQKFLAQEADAAHASFTSLVFWNDDEGAPFLEEERTMTFRLAPAPAYLLIDFTSKLKATRGDVMLDGDPEHAGVHFRPANEIDPKQTVYVFPKEGANPRKDDDYPWVGESYTLVGKRYSVVQMNHPDNPKGTRFSAYRNYGRFGAFFKASIKSGESLTVRYRFLIAEGEMPPADTIQTCCNEFAGTSAPAPKTSVLKAEQPAPPKKVAPGTDPKNQ
jgi:hypothetical protein